MDSEYINAPNIHQSIRCVFNSIANFIAIIQVIQFSSELIVNGQIKFNSKCTFMYVYSIKGKLWKICGSSVFEPCVLWIDKFIWSRSFIHAIPKAIECIINELAIEWTVWTCMFRYSLQAFTLIPLMCYLTVLRIEIATIYDNHYVIIWIALHKSIENQSRRLLANTFYYFVTFTRGRKGFEHKSDGQPIIFSSSQ